MKIYLIRHGESTSDIEDRYGGWYDDHLTERGQEQIKATASKLEGRGIEALFASPLLRAQETANIIAQKIGVSTECADGFRERHYGVLTGLTKEEAKQKYPEAVKRHEDYLNTDPEGESYDDFCNRVMKAFEAMKEKDYGTIAIVTHGGPIKCILRSLQMDVPEKLEDGAIIEIEL